MGKDRDFVVGLTVLDVSKPSIVSNLQLMYCNNSSMILSIITRSTVTAVAHPWNAWRPGKPTENIESGSPRRQHRHCLQLIVFL